MSLLCFLYQYKEFSISKNIMSRSILIKSFNICFLDFLHDISFLYPLNKDIKSSLKSIELINRLNPSLVIKIWNSNIYLPYQSFIDAGDISFFIDKNYTEDLSYISNANDILLLIDKIREPINSMSDSNRNHTMKHIQNLSKLSAAYF